MSADRDVDHSISGALDLTYGDSWLANVGDIFVAAEQSGLPTNQDVNSGNPIGMGMGTVCIHNCKRLTAADAYLQNAPSNLTIVADAAVAKVLIYDSKAIGVETVAGRRYHARSEVVLSGGAINTPQTLMLSGAGATNDLLALGIEPVVDLPMVGQNLQDHCFAPVGIAFKTDISGGPDSQSPSPMGWFKLPTLNHTPPSFVGHTPEAGTEFVGAICLIMNPQSTGTVRLHSTDPNAAPAIDPKFLSNPYDRFALIEGVRETVRLLSAPVFSAKTIKTYFPKDDSDEAIWASGPNLHCILEHADQSEQEHIRGSTMSSWHMSGTVKMGNSPSHACVDPSFRVFGLNSLRVVDMSVVPFVPNCHTQSTAYILGEIAGDVLAEEYNLMAPSMHSMARL
ncbi:hypothetical protein LTR62_002970 [Meristemomyces frigidus]|uniref:Glucose-methanol-choline oxidoreductase N-terminal domain-containing protein n=1 Tax=Meristemomyces frigidus TaxID=1508187 RepID=A0AAN7YKV5_9PEZI|nr:hypothetical protein LTR62_002970 [Meristemomyces frigidus]